MDVVEVLKTARAEMVNRGRATVNMVNEHGNVCLLGSIGVALEGEQFLAGPLWSLFSNDGAGVDAVNELAKHTPPSEFGSINTYEIVYEFNDDLDTTDQDVLNLFDKALADLGALATA